MGTHRARGVRAVATLLAAGIAFFLVGGVASAETAPTASDSGAAIGLGTSDDGSAGISVGDSDGAIVLGDDGASDGGIVVDDGADAANIDSDGDLPPIELGPASSKEITPEEAAAAGQGEAPEATAAAGVDGPAGTLWIVAGVVVLVAGAFGLSRIGRRAES